MRGVDGWRRARAQHMIVARALALLPQPRGGQPDERMEPVDGACDPRDQLNDEVVALHVRELVEQHVAPPLGGPVIGFGGQQNRGPANTPRHRYRRTLRLQQPDVTSETQLPGPPIDKTEPRPV